MLKKRIIPKLQMITRTSLRGVRPVLVVTKGFGEPRAVADPLSQAKIYEAQMVDELILVDIERTESSWDVLVRCLAELAENLATPISVGGGVRRLSQVQQLLDVGADKVIINSGALNNPRLIEEVASRYGEQCLVVSIDARSSATGEWSVWSDSGERESRGDMSAWAQEAADRGAGEIMITSIERDGFGMGLDLRLIEEVYESVAVPVIASGGCGLAKHFVEGFASGAEAVAAGTFFSLRDQNPIQCRAHVRNAGIAIRAGF